VDPHHDLSGREVPSLPSILVGRAHPALLEARARLVGLGRLLPREDHDGQCFPEAPSVLSRLEVRALLRGLPDPRRREVPVLPRFREGLVLPLDRV
jgi:hypothetical protein